MQAVERSSPLPPAQIWAQQMLHGRPDGVTGAHVAEFLVR